MQAAPALAPLLQVGGGSPPQPGQRAPGPCPCQQTCSQPKWGPSGARLAFLGARRLTCARRRWLMAHTASGMRKMVRDTAAFCLFTSPCTWRCATETGWDPAWDRSPMAFVPRAPKGKRHQLAKPDRYVVWHQGTRTWLARMFLPSGLPKSRLPLLAWTRRLQTTRRCVGRVGPLLLRSHTQAHVPSQRRPARLRKDSVVSLLSKKDPWER